MFRDRENQLQRLEEALLAEEEEIREDPSEEEELLQVDSTYANFANGYRVYNTDRSDEDLDEYSEDVYQAQSSKRTGLWVAILLVSLLLLGFFGGWLLKLLGVL